MKEYPVITISREYGSGGRIIGKRLAEELGLPFYDKDLITRAAEDSGLSPEVIAAAEDHTPSSLLYSLSTGGGLTLLLREARRMIASGMNLADTAEAINAMRHRVQITFSVDDMEPLRRSGRLGSVKLSVSTILNIRPMLRCENGSIQSYAVVRGQNEQLRALIKAVPPEATNVIIQHFAAEERAEKLAAYFRERGRKAEIRHIGPVLGIHLGAGSIALAWIDPE